MISKRGSVALALLAFGGLAGWGSSAKAVTLDTLLGGGSFTVGNATYSGFQYDNLPDASSVVVTAGTSGDVSTITFTRSGAPWSETDDHGVVQFHVDFATPISATGLDFLGTATGTAISGVTEDMRDGVTGFDYGSPTNLWVHTGVIPSVFSDSYTFGTPVTSLDVLKSIDVAAGVGDTGTITSVDNTYTAVPEPASLGLLAVGGLALIRRRRRLPA